MPLIEVSTVKSQWPRWEEYATLPDSTLTAEDVLDLGIENGETELLEYVEVTDATITPQLERHLLRLVKYHVFTERHGDTDFERPPQIVQDYEASIAMLERYRAGEFPVPNDDPEAEPDFRVNAKERRFDEWFQDDCLDDEHCSDF